MSAAHSVRTMLPSVRIAALWWDIHELVRAWPETAVVAVDDGQRLPLSDFRTEVGMDNDRGSAGERVLGWGVGPVRFLVGDRRWLPRWHFQPCECLVEDAFRLLEQAALQEYSMGTGEKGSFWVKVHVAGINGEARKSTKPRAITFAVERAFRINVDSAFIDAAGVRRRCDE